MLDCKLSECRLLYPSPAGDCRRTYKWKYESNIILTSLQDKHSLPFKGLANVVVSNDVFICYFLGPSWESGDNVVDIVTRL
jgi:hypothetical protein